MSEYAFAGFPESDQRKIAGRFIERLKTAGPETEMIGLQLEAMLGVKGAETRHSLQAFDGIARAWVETKLEFQLGDDLKPLEQPPAAAHPPISAYQPPESQLMLLDPAEPADLAEVDQATAEGWMVVSMAGVGGKLALLMIRHKNVVGVTPSV